MSTMTRRPELVTSLPGPRASAVVARDNQVVSPSYTRDYELVVDHAQGVWLWDVDGNKFLDMTAGIAVCATGHSHPRVVEAVRRQSEKFLHMAGTDFYYEVEVRLAEELARLTPGGIPRKVFFTNSGTEAVECAIKLVRHKTRRPGIIAFYGAFHGRSLGALSLTASKAIQREGFQPLLSGVSHVPYGNCAACVYRMTYPECELHCVKAIEETVLRHLTSPRDIAAVFVEPVQGEGGYVVPPPGWLQAIRRFCDAHDIVLVVDEIQSGMGRTGKFWACEHFDVVPDILLTAKGIASGLPLGACIAKSEIMKWGPGSHGSTFGGNPVACAAALATIEVIHEEGLMENSARVGKALFEALSGAVSRFPQLSHASGIGLMAAVHLKPEHERLRNLLVKAAFQRGLLILGCGRLGVRLSPALVATEEEARLAVALLEDALGAVAA
jgi:4-aminobutyrate aminotransferase